MHCPLFSTVMMLNTYKHHCSKSPMAIPSRKRGITTSFAPLSPCEKNITNVIFRIIVGSFCLIFSGSCLFLMKYPPLNQFWIVFGNPVSLQYLKNTSNLDDYKILSWLSLAHCLKSSSFENKSFIQSHPSSLTYNRK